MYHYRGVIDGSDPCEFVYGNECRWVNEMYEILDSSDMVYKVIKSKSLSEWTGLKDRLGTPIYQGDVAYVWMDGVEHFGFIDEGPRYWELITGSFTSVVLRRNLDYEIEVVGNMWDGNTYLFKKDK